MIFPSHGEAAVSRLSPFSPGGRRVGDEGGESSQPPQANLPLSPTQAISQIALLLTVSVIRLFLCRGLVWLRGRDLALFIREGAGSLHNRLAEGPGIPHQRHLLRDTWNHPEVTHGSGREQARRTQVVRISAVR